ncbi:LnmK family bifunctional acyltransferase/decarboxylase [Streptomyces sp. NPDC002680]|uniref:LnmK family bifunctional acyltransferase/decarboxylase n=1 Tax=Streptomyces sp. NPDC002680 TaxID=3364659 RepID=UPI0036864303
MPGRRRSREGGNTGLVSASPVGFTHDQLPLLPREFSPRAITSSARRAGSLLVDGRQDTRTAASPPYTTDHRIDPVRDLNGVGLVYFAAYFSIIDAAVLAYWRHLGRSDEEFLRRLVIDQKLCYFGNADTGTTVTLTVRAYVPSGGVGDEVLDISAHDRADGRLLAVCAIRLLREAVEEILHLPPGEVSLDETLQELGADSVDEVEIIAQAFDLLGLTDSLPAHERSRPLHLLVDDLSGRSR